MRFVVEKIIWGWPLIALILFASFYYCFKLRFVQLRLIRLMPKILFEKKKDEAKMSPLGTVSLILANHVGIGNILGVSAAILYGGPGAVFWMWITALVCSVLSFVENTLGQMYKISVNGEYRGGPAYYILKGIGSPFWSHAICFIFFLCLGLLMPTIQSAAISAAMNTAFNIPKIVIGGLVTVSIGYIIFGNSKRIVKASEIIVPFMALFYLLFAIFVIVFNFGNIIPVFVLIINNAINSNAVYGGIIGSAISYGIRRGLFSNESGIGSSPNISASSDVTHPVKQGLLSCFCVYIDTILICSATALMILTTNSYNIIHEGKLIYEGAKGVPYNQFVAVSIDSVLPGWGRFFVTAALFLFAYTSIFGGFYNAETNLIFLFKGRTYKIADFLYKSIFLIIIFLSAVFETETAWLFADIALGVAAFLNVIVIVMLKDKIVEVLKDFELKYKCHKDTNYVNNNLDCWHGKEKL